MSVGKFSKSLRLKIHLCGYVHHALYLIQLPGQTFRGGVASDLRVPGVSAALRLRACLRRFKNLLAIA